MIFKIQLKITYSLPLTVCTYFDAESLYVYVCVAYNIYAMRVDAFCFLCFFWELAISNSQI